jgi:hypothetical protein
MSNEISEQQRAELETQHGSVLVMGTDFGDFAFRVAGMTEFRQFSVNMEDPAKKFDALRSLSIGCLVWPTKDILAAAFEKLPGLVFGIGNELASHTGLTSRAARKK